jgi:hypothetical protein
VSTYRGHETERRGPGLWSRGHWLLLTIFLIAVAVAVVLVVAYGGGGGGEGY